MKTLAQGSYLRNDFQRPATGLGDDQSLSFADQTLLGIVQEQPTVTYTEWAKQDGDVAWNEVSPTTNYQAFAVTDQQLVAASSAATAVPIVLAVIAPKLTFATQVKKAFIKTPYEYVSTEAVYAQADKASPPAIYFLYWLRLRAQTDPDLGNVSLNYAATQVSGVLSYILETPLSGADRARPSVSFMQALQLQGTKSSLVVPQTQAEQTTTPVQTMAPINSPVLSSAASSNGKALLIVGLGAAAVFGGYHLVTRGKR